LFILCPEVIYMLLCSDGIMKDFFLMALVPLILLHLTYILSVKHKNFSFIDIAWGLGFIGISTTGLMLNNFSTIREITGTILVLFWGLRLATYLFLRSHGKPEDFRYATWRTEWGPRANTIAYFKIFWLQFFLMLMTGLPLFLIHAQEKSSLNWLDYLGICCWLIGFAWESIADYQKNNFKKNPSNKNKICQKGLWSLSRHPNYFGEALLWWGVGIISFAGGSITGLVGPLFLNFLLLKISGVPLIEKRHQNLPDFKDYQMTTPRFVPSLKKIFRSITTDNRDE
jgi:steroid 5-alpha reductase family enzyme